MNNERTIHSIKTRNLGRFSGMAAILSVVAACSGEHEPEELTGVAELAITAPAEVLSVSIQFRGETRTVARCVPVDGQMTRLAGLPTGLVAVDAQAFAARNCQGTAIWLAEPQTADLVRAIPVPISLVFRPNGIVDVDTTFEDDVACPGQAQVADWADEFDAGTLDSAWSVWQFAGQRMNGQSASTNSYSLTDNPGALRYLVDPMTYPGAMNDYAPMLSTYWYDPGIEVSRPISGTRWRVDMRADFYVPLVVNAAAFNVYLRFGAGSSNVYSAQFWRFSNDDSGSGQQTDNNRFAAGLGTSVYRPGADVEWFEQAALTPNLSRFVRFERDGLTLTIQVSDDAQTWTEVVRGDLPAPLGCEPQSIAFSGSSWFNPGGSYADYDYVRFTHTAP